MPNESLTARSSVQESEFSQSYMKGPFSLGVTDRRQKRLLQAGESNCHFLEGEGFSSSRDRRLCINSGRSLFKVRESRALFSLINMYNNNSLLFHL